jgi:hypothetical protein
MTLHNSSIELKHHYAHNGLMGWLIVVPIVIVLVVAPSFFADSRTGGDWKPSVLAGPARTLQPRPFSQSPGALVVRRAAARVLRGTKGSRSATSVHLPRRAHRHSPSRA